MAKPRFKVYARILGGFRVVDESDFSTVAKFENKKDARRFCAMKNKSK
jgi:hypothetical protein